MGSMKYKGERNEKAQLEDDDADSHSIDFYVYVAEPDSYGGEVHHEI